MWERGIDLEKGRLEDDTTEKSENGRKGRVTDKRKKEITFNTDRI